MKSEIQEIKRFYDEQTTRKINDFIKGNPRIDCAWQSLLSLLKNYSPVNIFEIGCGIGSISWSLAKQFPHSSVTGFDISEKSIALSKKIFKLPNLKFVLADDIALLPVDITDSYDLIVMMDVYEHIPPHQRLAIINFIQQTIAVNGTLFISCPTPRHLNYLKQHQPSEIQPVDEDITMIELMQLATSIGIPLVYYKEIGVWRRGDYFHAVFSSVMDLSPVSRTKTYSLEVSFRKELIKRIKSRINKNYHKQLKEKAKEQRMQMVIAALGKNF
jgi:trans-aconitate methyltransferase